MLTVCVIEKERDNSDFVINVLIYLNSKVFIFIYCKQSLRENNFKLSILIPLIYKLDWVLDMFSKAYTNNTCEYSNNIVYF